LDILILCTVLFGPGHQIAKHIQRTTEDVLQGEHGFYPALHRLERKGWLVSKWEIRAQRRELNYYRLTASGPQATRLTQKTRTANDAMPVSYR
jgi:PadR family transcriptional regulator, regulatory protein PadR